MYKSVRGEIPLRWIEHLSNENGIDALFELQTWLRGLCAFFKVQHLALSENERTDLVRRSFAPELGAALRAVERSQALVNELIGLGQPRFARFRSNNQRDAGRAGSEDLGEEDGLIQETPLDSLSYLQEVLSDLKIMLLALDLTGHLNCQVYRTLGEGFIRHLRGSRFLESLLGHKFNPWFDSVENAYITRVLRSISSEPVRRSVSLILLHLFRVLRYLGLISRDVANDQPLRACLVIFALIHDEMGLMENSLKSRLLKDTSIQEPIHDAAAFIVRSLNWASRKLVERDLVYLAREAEAASVHGRVGAAAAQCSRVCRNGVFLILRAIDRDFDGRNVFSTGDYLTDEEDQLLRDLWGYRQEFRQRAEKTGELDPVSILANLGPFKERSMGYLSSKQIAEYQRLADQMVLTHDRETYRQQTQRFVDFLDSLIASIAARPPAMADAGMRES